MHETVREAAEGAAPAVERIAIPTPAGPPVWIRLHRAQRPDPIAWLLLVPAGAWSGEKQRSDDQIARVSREFGFSVAELERGEHAPPAAQAARADAAVALAWLRTRAAAGETAVERVGAIGAHTGANLVSALAADALTRPDAVVLMSGIYDVPTLLGSGAAPLDAAALRAHLGPQFLALAADPAVSAARADLRGFPPAYLHADDRDDALREQTIAMVRALARADSPVTSAVTDGGTSTPDAELEHALAWLARTLLAPPARIGDPDHPVTLALAQPST